MSIFYRFIATKTSYATSIPTRVSGIDDLARRVSMAMRATAYPTFVGQLFDFPLATAVPNFLLCNGSEVDQLSFPELSAYLGDSQGVAAAGKFKLPNYEGVSTPAPTYPPQVIAGGAVDTGGTPTEPATPGQAGGTTGGDPVSGGRIPRAPNENFD